MQDVMAFTFLNHTPIPPIFGSFIVLPGNKIRGIFYSQVIEGHKIDVKLMVLLLGKKSFLKFKPESFRNQFVNWCQCVTKVSLLSTTLDDRQGFVMDTTRKQKVCVLQAKPVGGD